MIFSKICSTHSHPHSHKALAHVKKRAQDSPLISKVGMKLIPILRRIATTIIYILGLGPTGIYRTHFVVPTSSYYPLQTNLSYPLRRTPYRYSAPIRGTTYPNSPRLPRARSCASW